MNSRNQAIIIEPNQSKLDEFDNLKQHREILHRGYLDEKKNKKTRIISMNENGFRNKHAEKIDQMIEFCKNNKIDAAMLSKTNGKQTKRTIDAMTSKKKNQEEKQGVIMQIVIRIK